MKKEIIPIVHEAVLAAGGQHSLAKSIGVTPQRVHNWLRNGIPAKFVIQVAWHSGVSRHKLQPDIYPEEKMSLYQCENCGCMENTALGFYWTARLRNDEYKDKKLCSACGPTKSEDGRETPYGKWHGEFPRIYLPKGMFITDREGNLAHKLNGDTNFRAYAIYPEEK